MNTHKMKLIHHSASCYQIEATFLLNNRLLTLEIGTPNFNDYNEWRLSEIIFSSEDYKPEENEIELTPIENFPEFELTDDEVKWLNFFFQDEVFDVLYKTGKEKDDFDKKTELFLKQNPNFVDPFEYLGYEHPLISVYYEHRQDELTHYIRDETGVRSTGEPMHDVVDEIPSSEWENKDNITVHHGLYNLMIPIIEAISKNYYEN